MKLEGTLDAFSLPDIFQLLSFTKKTGGLHLAHGASVGAVFFAGGQVTGASADSSRQPLARRLVGSGALDDEALTAAVAAVVSGAAPGVVRALLDAGALAAEELLGVATEQTLDAVFDLLRWREGDFAFVVDEPNPDEVGVGLGVEEVLAGAEVRRTTWETVSQVVPSPQAVLAMPLAPGAEPAVTREEWGLLALVDGRRTVADLVDLTGAGQYAVVSALAALVQRGLLEVRDDAQAREDHVSAVTRRQQLLAPLEGEPFVPRHDDNGQPDSGQHDNGQHDNGQHDSGQHDKRQHDNGQVSGPSAVPTARPAEAVAPGMLGGAHVPGDVVPPRPEPYLPKRQADFAETPDLHSASPPMAAVAPGAPRPVLSGNLTEVGAVVGATATVPDPSSSVIERDPSVNRSLMLRLIAGVRGL